MHFASLPEATDCDVYIVSGSAADLRDQLRRSSPAVRSRTILLGYDDDLLHGSPVVGSRTALLVDYALAGAIPTSAVSDWTGVSRFTGPRAMVPLMRATCLKGFQCANYCRWSGPADESLAAFVVRYGEKLREYLAVAEASLTPRSETWQEPGKWGPGPVLWTETRPDVDLLGLASDPAMSGIDVLSTAGDGEARPAAAYLIVADTPEEAIERVTRPAVPPNRTLVLMPSTLPPTQAHELLSRIPLAAAACTALPLLPSTPIETLVLGSASELALPDNSPDGLHAPRSRSAHATPGDAPPGCVKPRRARTRASVGRTPARGSTPSGDMS